MGSHTLERTNPEYNSVKVKKSRQ